MSNKETPILGPTKTRVKTDIWIGKQVKEYVDQFSQLLGVPRGVVFTMAVAQFMVFHAPLIKSAAKRKTMVAALEKEFARILERIKETL